MMCLKETFAGRFGRLSRFLAVAAALAACAVSLEARTLWLVGDSTVRVGTPGQQGWGTPLPEFFKRSLDIENKAMGGRSSRTFLTEGLWEEVRDQLRRNDYVMIQFGHNDSGQIGGEFLPGRPARASIPGNGDETEEVEMPGGTTEVVHSYGAYLRRYVKEALEEGAQPIIITPIPKRGFIDGKARRDFGGYAEAAREAAEQLGVPLLDLNTIIADKYDEIGEEAAVAFFDDNVHTTPEGAAFNARCVAEGVRDLEDCDLKRYLDLDD